MAEVIENKLIETEVEQFYENGIPKGCDPIREEEFERLPEYVIELIDQSDRGELKSTTRAELNEIAQHFFSVQNSTSLENESNENDEVVILNEEDEQGGSSDIGTRGEIHSPQQ